MPKENIHNDEEYLPVCESMIRTVATPYYWENEGKWKNVKDLSMITVSGTEAEMLDMTNTRMSGIEADLEDNTYESEMVNIGVTELEAIEQGITLLNELLIEKMEKATPKTRSYNNTAIVKQIESDLERAEASALYIDNLINQSCLES